jgi:hypothetical protein
VAKLRDEIAADLPAIIAAVVEAAKAGDMTAAKLCLERVLPAMKPVEMPTRVNLPPDPSEAASAVLGAVSAGILTPADARALMSAVRDHVGVLEVTELERRIAALEART